MKDSKKHGLNPGSINIPDAMKEGFADQTEFSFNDAKVHYNSDQPAHLQALAYTHGFEILITPGQEKHLEHDLSHVVQQKRGIVRPTPEQERHLEHDLGNVVKQKQGVAKPIAGTGVIMNEDALHEGENDFNRKGN
jgi:hypothetical protein